MKSYNLIILILLTIIFFFSGQATVSAATDNDIHFDESILQEISLDGVGSYWDQLVEEYGGYLPEIEKTSIYEFVKNQDSFSLKNTIVAFLEYLFHELIANGKLLGTLLMLTLFSVILQTMHSAFERNAVSKIAYFVIYLVLIFIALNSFYVAVSYTQEAIEMMKGFMIALLPLMLGMMASFGNVIAVSFFHPIIIFLINFSGILVSTFILPLLFLSAMLLIVSSLSENYKVTHLANLFKTVGLGALGIFLTIFLGVISVQGTASAIQDGLAMKTAKFVTGNFIPVVGRTFTDAADTILSASLVLKNAVGMAGLLVILLIVLFPALKIAAVALIYKIAAAALQPIGGGPVITALNTISNYILYILACLLAVSLMFLLAIVIIVSASNITILLR
ncbi:stage III sporulation protein AE [Oceanobacillus profundus]|uniref:Stage III sporulation protein AE n=1 Tax=Oceanobacillus profundus TaxID=372463 RepID=A0A417YG12_9BACI|nr:stage III sporulation protein AE [Oceanobacillus profundus]MBR3118925.1 stage III sporulation protein AE [Oceanobacillus sp.]MDO6448031.1 stage III sporulation protein AE [Oceanobacillus profundus]RHW31688.1 stage III sporulation protein AE [Oceanobacillus profundus]